MSRKKIFTIGAQELRGKSRPITRFDTRLALILRDMADTMYEANGVGGGCTCRSPCVIPVHPC